MTILRRSVLMIVLSAVAVSGRAASYGIVTDTGPDARAQLNQTIALAHALIEAQAADDRALLISASGGEITLQQGLTKDKDRLHDAADNLFIENKAWHPIDALYLAASELAEADGHLLVLLSTGVDQGSAYTPAQLAALLADKKIRLHVIGVGPGEAAKKSLTELATATGGKSAFPTSEPDRKKVVREVIAALHAAH